MFELAGTILDIDQENNRAVLFTKNKLVKGQTLEVMPFQGKAVEIKIEHFLNLQNDELEIANPNSLVWIPWKENVEKLNVVRFRTEERSMLSNNGLKKVI